MIRIPKIIFIVLAILLLWEVAVNAKQMQPDAKRVKQIQSALVSHGYGPGKNWSETQEILRGIAQSHDWQVVRAPDARVLILLGLGNEHSDATVSLAGRNHLDGPEKQ